ncbi:MAG: alginate export family protein [Methyloprofundus sp.]|nr:alginate export family protein [Methyloprofundus sp.]
MPSKKTSKRFLLTPLSSAILAAIFMQSAAAYEFDKPIENAFKLGQDDAKYGQIKLDLNYRFEMSDIANNAKDTGLANTLRLRLGYLTPKFHGLQGFAEFEGNLGMQKDYFAPLASPSFDARREVIADPQASELNQLWVSFTGIPDTEIKGGRQRIKLDDDRFIGNVGWRQMEQTYDGVIVTNTSVENLTLKAGYIANVQNIWSQEDAVQLPFLNANYQYKDLVRVTGYGYWFSDYDTGQAGRSTQTYGVALNGSPKITQDITLHYTAEYSYQGDYANNPNSINLSRYNLMGGASFMGVTLKGAVEELGANGTQAFQTPFGTNHGFQGWADMFLVTPKDGVRDINATLGAAPLGIKMAFVYHNFQSVTNNIDYGNEYDFLITKKFGKHYQLLAKYAYYDANEANGIATLNKDVNKFWLQASVSF